RREREKQGEGGGEKVARQNVEPKKSILHTRCGLGDEFKTGRELLADFPTEGSKIVIILFGGAD
ncbi:hypothetical protein Dimus_036145, partial [Dionaea muscipula]